MRQLNRLSVYILKRYLLLLLGLSIMAFGVAFSIKASLGHISDFQCTLCGQPVYAVDALERQRLLCIAVSHCHADSDLKEKLPSDPVNAASGCIFLWLSDGFRSLGGSGDQL